MRNIFLKSSGKPHVVAIVIEPRPKARHGDRSGP